MSHRRRAMAHPIDERDQLFGLGIGHIIAIGWLGAGAVIAWQVLHTLGLA